MYFKILLHVVVFGLAGYLITFVAFAADHRQGNAAVPFAFMGGCTGMIIGAILGATNCILRDLPDAIERAMFVRKIRSIDLDEREEK